MPVEKFRSIEDMPDTPRRTPGDPALYKAMRSTWNFGRSTNPRQFPPGVYRFRSIEEMSRAQETWEIEHARALAARRKALREGSGQLPGSDE